MEQDKNVLLIRRLKIIIAIRNGCEISQWQSRYLCMHVSSIRVAKVSCANLRVRWEGTTKVVVSQRWRSARSRTCPVVHNFVFFSARRSYLQELIRKSSSRHLLRLISFCALFPTFLSRWGTQIPTTNRVY